jgi:hypothetical protein
VLSNFTSVTKNNEAREQNSCGIAHLSYNAASHGKVCARGSNTCWLLQMIRDRHFDVGKNNVCQRGRFLLTSAVTGNSVSTRRLEKLDPPSPLIASETPETGHEPLPGTQQKEIAVAVVCSNSPV